MNSIAGFALVNGRYRFGNGRRAVLSEDRGELETLKAETDPLADEPSAIHPAWIIREGWEGRPGWMLRREGEGAPVFADRRGVATPEIEERFAEARKRLVPGKTRSVLRRPPCIPPLLLLGWQWLWLVMFIVYVEFYLLPSFP